MPDEYEVVSVQNIEIESLVPGVPGTSAYQISMRKPDGEMHHHVFPTHTIVAHAIEYDLHPENDVDTIVDMIVHEPFAPNAGDTDDPAVAEGYVTTINGMKVAAALHTAETIQDAREAHQLRNEFAKRERVKVKMPDEFKKWLRDQHKTERKAIREGRKKEHKEIKGLKDIIRLRRHEIRGRGDGKPLKARIAKNEEAAE